MIWLLTIAITTVLTFKEILYSDGDGLFDYGWPESFLGWAARLFFCVLISGGIALPQVGLGAWIGSMPARIGVQDQSLPLIALREKDGFQGHSYFLGIGQIKDQQYYFWYATNPDGSVSGDKTDRDSCVKIYQQPGVPHIITFKTAYDDPKVALWLPLVGFDMRGAAHWCPWFYVPPGTIQQGYTL